jgi:hypothetical protein
VDAISRFNKFAIWEMQFLRLFLVNAHLLTGMYEFVEANDDEMGLKSENIWFNVLLNAVFNSLEFRSVFDKGAGMNPFALDAIFGFTSHLREYKNSPNADGVKEARAVMAEMINASRNNEEIYDRSGYVIAASIGAIFGEKKETWGRRSPRYETQANTSTGQTPSPPTTSSKGRSGSSEGPASPSLPARIGSETGCMPTTTAASTIGTGSLEPLRAGPEEWVT